jgi:nucleoside-diphosphate-sugar epimerase
MSHHHEHGQIKHRPKHALIIGSSGMVGHLLSRKLSYMGDWLITGVQRHEKPFDLKEMNILTCNLLNENEAKECLQPLVDSVTHLFYIAWTQCDDPKKEVDENLRMFKNVIDTISKGPNLKHVYLQTGTQYYGMHVGPQEGLCTPSKEDHPRMKHQNHFYYALEDYLRCVSQKKETSHRSQWTYHINRPPCIIGYTHDTAWNLGVSIAAYASLLKHLGKPLIFPGNEKCYHALREIVDARLLVKCIFWQVNHRKICNGEAFNVTNDDLFRWSHLWPRIGQYFGMETKIDPTFDVCRFLSDNQAAWQDIVHQYGLQQLPLKELVTTKFLKSMLDREWDEASNIGKLHKLGFFDTCETQKTFFSLFDRLKIKGVAPDFSGLLYQGTTSYRTGLGEVHTLKKKAGSETLKESPFTTA